MAGLYLVGAGTHPGAGLPGVLCSAKVLGPVGGACLTTFETDLLACREMLRGGSRSFFAASRLLPGRVRRPATALYAFCRVADDLIDNGDPAPALDALHRRLEAIYAGRPGPEPSDRALSHVVQQHRVPRVLLDRLLEGFAWDAEGRRYEDLPALEAYAARVAGTVGAMMAVLMGAREPGTLARACDLGVAMQLTNIARDVGEDARAGRLYLPLSWMREAGLDPEAWLARPEPSPALAAIIARLVAAAGELYRRADAGIAALPLDCRPGIGTARLSVCRDRRAGAAQRWQFGERPCPGGPCAQARPCGAQPGCGGLAGTRLRRPAARRHARPGHCRRAAGAPGSRIGGAPGLGAQPVRRIGRAAGRAGLIRSA